MLKKLSLERQKSLLSTLTSFEEIHLPDTKLEEILSSGEQHVCADAEDETIMRNIVHALEFIEGIDPATTPVDLNLYKELNRILTNEQALVPGELRDGDVFISGVKDAIKPSAVSFVEEQLHRLETVEPAEFKEVVAEVFCRLCKAQPFWDGNKRSTLLVCNYALLKKDLGYFTIATHQEDIFNVYLTAWYAHGDLSEFGFLSTNCIHGLRKASDELLQHKDEVLTLFKEAEKDGIFNVRLVGSVSRGEDTEDSDVDFLVSTPVKGKMLKALALGGRLEELLHRKVDVLIEENLPVYLRHMVNEAIKYE